MRALVFLGLFVPSFALAVPMQFAHQGRLHDSVGDPLEGAVQLDFAIYDAPSSGTALWTETTT